MPLKESFKNYFTYNKKDINGTIVLSIILIFTIFIAYFYQNKKAEVSTIDPKVMKYIMALDSVSPELQNEDYNSTPYFDNAQNQKHNLTPFPFNPNKLPAEEWLRMGFSKKQVQVIKNYEAKGGYFRKKEDVAKIYAISEHEYLQIEPFINLPSDIVSSNKAFQKETRSSVIIELNRADTIELTKLYGIGTAYARRIYKYRNSLGGFVKKEQLLEVWGLDTATFLQIRNKVNVDTNGIRKININTADFKTINDHPYIDYNQTKSILNYRKKLGNFRKIEDLKQVPLLTKEMFEKIKPYIKVRD